MAVSDPSGPTANSSTTPFPPVWTYRNRPGVQPPGPEPVSLDGSAVFRVQDIHHVIVHGDADREDPAGACDLP
jgi:hypothetical protein